MKAVVMAGGEGSRLRPLTSNQPKPLVSVLNRPVIEYILELLKEHKITDIVVTLQFLPQLIKGYFGEGEDIGVKLSYAIEETPLGTAGSVKNAEEHLDETFVVISGDALTDIDLSKVIEFHKKRKSWVTIALKRVENPLEFGIIITGKNGRIERFLEKPSWGEVFSDTVNTGIYILEPEVFKYIPKDRMFDFSQDLFPTLLKQGKPLYGCVVGGYWCDIGNLEQYRDAHRDILNGKVKARPPGIKMLKDVWLGKGAYIHPTADLSGPVVVGQYARIEEGAKIGKHSVIGNNVSIGAKAHLNQAIVSDNSYIGPSVHLTNCYIGKNSDVKAGVRVGERVVIGDECIIGENAVINHDVKIYPFKTVDTGATINKSIIFESRGVHTLFGRHGVSGIVNVDITPELATRLAMAYGTVVEKGSHVVTSRDPSRISRMIKRALISGLNATGVHCRDLRVAPTPINRFNVHTSRCVGGIHTRVSPFDPQSVEIAFFDSSGTDINDVIQRKIERYYYREDFRRAFYNEVGETIFPARTSEFYTDGLLKAIDKDLIREAKLRVVADYSYGSASLILPHVLGKLNCDVISLHAFTDEDKTTISSGEFERSMRELSRTVEAFKAHFGMLIDSACEKVYLVDEKGRRIGLNDALFLMISLLCQFDSKKGKIAVPLTASSMVEELAANYNRKVVRTKVSPQALMGVALRRDVAFAGAQGGGYIFPQFLPAYDAVMTFCKLLEYLAKARKPFSSLLSEIPKPNLAHKSTFCPWDHKGLVMRRLVERAKGKQVELLDGVKIFDTDRWTLILPDPEEPVFRIYAEANSLARAKAEVESYVSFISQVVAG